MSDCKKGPRCLSRYGPYRCRLDKNHSEITHQDGKVCWARLQRWRAELPTRKEAGKP
jgi:hypothetical protein